MTSLNSRETRTCPPNKDGSAWELGDQPSQPTDFTQRDNELLTSYGPRWFDNLEAPAVPQKLGRRASPAQKVRSQRDGSGPFTNSGLALKLQEAYLPSRRDLHTFQRGRETMTSFLKERLQRRGGGRSSRVEQQNQVSCVFIYPPTGVRKPQANFVLERFFRTREFRDASMQGGVVACLEEPQGSESHDLPTCHLSVR